MRRVREVRRQAIVQLATAAKTVGLGPPVRWADRQWQRIRPVAPDIRRSRIDEEHLRLLLSFALAADSNCIDVGAHQGDILTHMVKYAPLGHHIAYEPLPDLYGKLVERFPEVDVRCAALSRSDGESTFTHVIDLPGWSGFKEQDYPKHVTLETITVKTERLDNHLPPDYVPKLIKIDVAGAKQLVLEGAIEMITRHRPIIVLEHGRAASSYGTRSAGIFRLLCEEVGLRIFDFDGRGPYTLAEFEKAACWNFVAHR